MTNLNQASISKPPLISAPVPIPSPSPPPPSPTGSPIPPPPPLKNTLPQTTVVVQASNS